ncbi:hypothetical protein PIB30_024307 [Stylosanthes scabra]|uniref:DUF241 domain protein n=1 Tax=Stylosanthes scabra TaxID=79078 RepID=A0ABU6XBF7_9FABA|nr:hypothetical protein [Stylosanthes scabra]
MDSSSTSSSVMNADLTRLVHLYNCVNEQIIGSSSLSEKALLHDHHHQEKYLDKLLDMSLVFLDVCGSTRELLQLVKEHARDLQSAMRRRKGQDYSTIKSQICAYLCFKKRAKREISKILKALQKIENSGNKRVIVNNDEIHDVFLSTIVKKTNNGFKDDLEIVKRRLEGIDGCVRELEAGLSCLFRCLIRHRVSLLNLLTPL